MHILLLRTRLLIMLFILATRALLRFSAAVAILGLLGCVTHFDRLPQSSPLPQPRSIAAVGEFRHTPSVMSYQVRWAHFNGLPSLSTTPPASMSVRVGGARTPFAMNVR
jgi:hypothetical protein